MNTTNETHSKGFNPFSGYPIFFFSDPPRLIKKNNGTTCITVGLRKKNNIQEQCKDTESTFYGTILLLFLTVKRKEVFLPLIYDLDNLSKMRVKLAVQTLSSKVADEMSTFENNTTSSTQEYLLNSEKFWKVFNDPKPLRAENDARVTMFDEALAYFMEWQESRPTMYATKSEQGQHFIAWQTMFDLQVIHNKSSSKKNKFFSRNI